MARNQSTIWKKLSLLGIVLAGLWLLWPRPEAIVSSPASPAASSVIPKQLKPEIAHSRRESSVLLAAYLHAKNSAKKEQLLNALAQTQDRSITGRLIELLAVETDEAAADTMQWMLVRMADATMLRQIVERYESVPGAAEAKRLTTLVQRIRSDELAGLLVSLVDAPIAMEDMLTKAALVALREIGSPFVADALARRLNSAITEADQAYLEAALAGICRPGTQHSLIAIATDQKAINQSATRVAAIQALSNFHDPETRDALSLLAQSKAPEIAAAAQKVIGQKR